MMGISNRCAMTSAQCVGILQNNHENNSVEQKHSKREHQILFWIKMTTHLWDFNNKELHCQDKW